ncbi:hypothetical protein [Ectopseudomonas mendocina]|uniref:Uncharacterized protein n=1 Tax=Ectopseudomonas mendocina TaxID=300 RepID=A0A2R3QHQ8_ECTME|nr:hypothetical protein [Pseudomonas mendocina]AVO51247.1 hypothetical protein C7A17_00165 [Pseudomonas mendocina]
MSQRKPYNHQARLATYFRSLLRSNHVAVLDIEHLELQVLVDWKHARAIGNGREAVATAVTDFGLLRQASHSQNDRRKLTKVLLLRGRSVDYGMTKIFKGAQ